VDLDVGAGSRTGRNMCEPTGIWVKPVCGSATRGERKDVKITLTGRVWWVVESRGSKSLLLTEGLISFFQYPTTTLPNVTTQRTST